MTTEIKHRFTYEQALRMDEITLYMPPKADAYLTVEAGKRQAAGDVGVNFKGFPKTKLVQEAMYKFTGTVIEPPKPADIKPKKPGRKAPQVPIAIPEIFKIEVLDKYKERGIGYNELARRALKEMFPDIPLEEE